MRRVVENDDLRSAIEEVEGLESLQEARDAAAEIREALDRESPIG